MLGTADSSRPLTPSGLTPSGHSGLRRQVRFSHTPDTVALHGPDPPDETSVQRCGETQPLRVDIRDLCQPYAPLSNGTASLPQGPSGPTVSSYLPDERRHFTQPDHTSGQEISASAPPQVRTGVCPQPRPTLTQHTAVVRDSQSRTATAPAAVIPHHFLDAENAFSEGKEDPPHSSWASRSETPVRVPDTNAPADLSPCNGNSAILGQHEACPDRDDHERTRPVTTPSVRHPRATRELFTPLPTAAGLYDGSLTYMNDEVVLFWQPPSAFSQWTLSPFTVNLVEYNCAEQFMMASKARLFGDDSTLSAILSTDDPREHKRFGRQVRHFDNDTWLNKRENIALRGNLAKFSQNENLRSALLHTGDRRLAEASPYDNIWGIGLRVSDHRASSPHTWRGSNLLGQTLEHVRTILCENTPPSAGIPLPDIPSPLTQPGDTVFEVDPTTRTRLDPVSITEYSSTTALSAFLNSAPDDHTPEVLLTHATRGDQPLMPEQGPDLIGGVVTMDDVTFTTLPSLTSGAFATSQFRCRALLDTGSPQSFIHQGAFEQMVATGAADESYVRSTPPKSWSGFGSGEPLNTNRQARLTVQFYHNNTPSASLAVWIYIVPNKTMRCPLLLGRDSWMRFHSRSYRTLAPTPDGRVFGELTLSHTFDDAGTSATAYIRSCGTTNVVHQLRYDGSGMSLTSSPQLVPVNLTRLNGHPALTGHYMVDIATSHDDQYPSEHFVASGRQTIPLTGNRDLEHGDILGTASAPLLRVPLKALIQHNEQSDVTAVSEATAANAAPTASDQPPSELLHRLDVDQREAFFRLWSTVPHHMRQIDFALDAPGWDSDAIDALSATLKEYADIFSSSKLDYGACSLRPVEIKVPPGTHPIQSRPYRLNPVLSKQVDAILDSYLAAGLIQHSTSPWSSPLVCVPKESGGI